VETLREAGRDEDQKIAGEDRLSKKRGEADRQKWKELVDKLGS
jgi:hypothetical protein